MLRAVLVLSALLLAGCQGKGDGRGDGDGTDTGGTDTTNTTDTSDSDGSDTDDETDTGDTELPPECEPGAQAVDWDAAPSIADLGDQSPASCTVVESTLVNNKADLRLTCDTNPAAVTITLISSQQVPIPLAVGTGLDLTATDAFNFAFSHQRLELRDQADDALVLALFSGARGPEDALETVLDFAPVDTDPVWDLCPIPDDSACDTFEYIGLRTTLAGGAPVELPPAERSHLLEEGDQKVWILVGDAWTRDPCAADAAFEHVKLALVRAE